MKVIAESYLYSKELAGFRLPAQRSDKQRAVYPLHQMRGVLVLILHVTLQLLLKIPSDNVTMQ